MSKPKQAQQLARAPHDRAKRAAHERRVDTQRALREGLKEMEAKTMTIIVHEDSHTDHGVTEHQRAYALEQAAELPPSQGVLVATIAKLRHPACIAGGCGAGSAVSTTPRRRGR